MKNSVRDDSAPVGSPPGSLHSHGGGSQSQDVDLFSFLSAMHLSNGAGGGSSPGSIMAAAAAAASVTSSSANGGPVQLVTSRKRKLLEQGGGGSGHGGGGGSGGSSGKLNSVRPPFLRRSSDDEESAALHTPQCSQSGYADDEDHDPTHHTSTSSGLQLHHHHMLEAAAVAAAQQQQLRKASNFFSPMNPQLSEIDDNLAANFDDSLSGLGVDLSAANYSMSEALLALPNLSISSGQMFKHEVVNANSPSARAHEERCKEEPLSRESSTGANGSGTPQNFGALDLSNDEAHLPDSATTIEVGPKTFIGSVSKEKTKTQTVKSGGSEERCAEAVPGGRQRRVSDDGDKRGSQKPSINRSHKVILPLIGGATPVSAVAVAPPEHPVSSAKAETLDRLNETACGDKFQYILAAATSLATKINDPSITYLNQGQAYELRLKKLGDLSAYHKRRLKCVLRICFHERRLQYMEAEQIAEWRAAHPGERILDVDLPLSYGVIDVVQDPAQANVVSFRWDPTRDTGIFIKVNCISTEFTLKKHGGEKGVPFRLQVETYEDEDVADFSGQQHRLHAAGCILQVFKLKGADRKHKQDREKINKRPPAEQEKFAPSYDCTVLSELSVDTLYVPPTSRPASPPRDRVQVSSSPTPMPSQQQKVNLPESPCLKKKDSSPLDSSSPRDSAAAGLVLRGLPLSPSASSEMVGAWLAQNRYSAANITAFRNFDGRDMLRLLREDVTVLCGLSEGIRLYNDLHMAVVAPRTTFYVTQKETSDSSPLEFHALFLAELTVGELLHRLGEAVGLSPALLGKAFIVGAGGGCSGAGGSKQVGTILIRVTDEVVRYTKPESVFHFSLRQRHHGSPDEVCDVVLEPVLEPLTIDESPGTDLQQQSHFHDEGGGGGGGGGGNGNGNTAEISDAAATEYEKGTNKT